MREIKFRGKRLENYEWVYGSLVVRPDGTHQIICFTPEGTAYTYDVDPETVGQYPGLKDKNGVEIYEGDVVRQIAEERDWEFDWFVIKYQAPEFTLRNGGLTNFGITGRWDGHEYEIIGNIYENPELLKPKI